MARWQTFNWFTQDGTRRGFRKVAFTDEGVVFHKEPPAFRTLEVPRRKRSEPKRGTWQWMTDGERYEQDYDEGTEDVSPVGKLRTIAPSE